MAEVDDALARLRDAAQHLATLDAERADASRRRDDALRAARDARATYVEMQEASGLSAVTVSKALKRE